MSEVGRLIDYMSEALEKGELKGEKFTISKAAAEVIYNTLYGMGCDFERTDLMWKDE